MVDVLFARTDSIYKSIPGCDVWDMERDARKYDGSNPVVCHPPCREWGNLSHWSKGGPEEKALAFLAIDLIRKNGGVLEHPITSKLWPVHLPLPGKYDEHGGYTIAINQSWFGHKAKKATFLYIVGVPKQELPPIPITFNAITHYIGYPKSFKGKSKYGMKEVSKAEREHTPPQLAQWLIQTAELTRKTPETYLLTP